MADKYQYKIFRYMTTLDGDKQEDLDRIINELNVHGENGWDVYAFDELNISGKICFLFWMKKEKLL
jgi:hypothetical protein